MSTGSALIVGAGSGVSAAFARALAAADSYQVVLAARNIEKLDALCAEIGATGDCRCDATSVDSVKDLFQDDAKNRVGPGRRSSV